MFYRNILPILDNKFIMFDNLISFKNGFEEVSLFLRYEQVKLLNMDVRDVNVTLFNLAFFHLKNIKTIARSKLNKEDFENLFICLTITDDINEDDFITPNFYVSDIRRMFFLRELKICKNKIINNIFIELEIFDSISVLESSWFDEVCNCELRRYYIVSNEIIKKIEYI